MTRRIVDLNNNLGLSSPFSRQARRREMGPSRILLIAGQIGNHINSARRLSVSVVTTCLLTSNTFASFLRNTSLNPCGAGVTPTQCTCQNGATYSPGSVRPSIPQTFISNAQKPRVPARGVWSVQWTPNMLLSQRIKFHRWHLNYLQGTLGMSLI